MRRSLQYMVGDTLQLPLFTRNCDTVISYHKNYTLSLSWNILPVCKNLDVLRMLR